MEDITQQETWFLQFLQYCWYLSNIQWGEFRDQMDETNSWKIRV